MQAFTKGFVLAGLLTAASGGQAADMLTQRNVGMELARDIASEAVLACRKKGYHVSAVVVDRSATVRAALRDDLASRFTLQIAREKANAVILSGTDTGTFVRKRADIVPELNEVDGIIMLRGGVPIEAGGYRIGAVGVSGAPGGELDEACARAALDKLEDRMAFAE